MRFLEVYPDKTGSTFDVDKDFLEKYRGCFSQYASIDFSNDAEFCYVPGILPGTYLICYYSSDPKSGMENTVAKEILKDEASSVFGPIILNRFEKTDNGWGPTNLLINDVKIIERKLGLSYIDTWEQRKKEEN